MSEEMIPLDIHNSAVEKDGKFAVLLHWGDGTPIVTSGFTFSTENQAKLAGAAILDQGIAKLLEKGLVIQAPDES